MNRNNRYIEALAQATEIVDKIYQNSIKIGLAHTSNKVIVDVDMKLRNERRLLADQLEHFLKSHIDPTK